VTIMLWRLSQLKRWILPSLEDLVK
jgi:hypothetical protein